MIISDLAYLETISEASSIVGGHGKKDREKGHGKPYKKYGANIAVAANVNTTVQNATAIAIGKNSTAITANVNKTEQNAVAAAVG